MWKWSDLKEVDWHKNQPCEWCGKHDTVFRMVITGEDTDHIILLCSFCSLFDTKEEMEQTKSTIITNAINPELSELYGHPWL